MTTIPPSTTPSAGHPAGALAALPRGHWLVAVLLGLAFTAFHAAHGLQLSHSVLMQSFNWLFDYDTSRFLGGWCTPGADVGRDMDVAFVPRHALSLSIRPLCLALLPLAGEPGKALMLLTALCAGASVAAAYALAASFCEHEFDRILAAVAFGLSAQPLLLGVIPEAYGFALLGIGLHLAWLAGSRGTGLKTGTAVASLVMNLGFTVTNAALNLISAAVLAWQRMPWRTWLRQQALVWALGGGAVVVLTVAAAWVFAPELLGVAGSAPKRVWWIININRGEPASLPMVVCTFILYNFVAPAFTVIDLPAPDSHPMLDFRSFSFGWTGTAALLLWSLAMLASVWLAWARGPTRRLLVVVALWLLANLALHGYWQFRGSVWLYTAHTSFALFAVLAMGYGAAVQRFGAARVRALAVLLVALEAMNNYALYSTMITFVLGQPLAP